MYSIDFVGTIENNRKKTPQLQTINANYYIKIAISQFNYSQKKSVSSGVCSKILHNQVMKTLYLLSKLHFTEFLPLFFN